MFQEFLFGLQNIVNLLLAKNSTKLTLKNPSIAVCELFSAKLFKEKLKLYKRIYVHFPDYEAMFISTELMNHE
ncbi:hypothetical protein T07_2633 [Trichinella nelsoni]|uniref:Uncharacterized protein n=1 Tax=Trichinella nelsoni TaxID=6336 RepID=A0A0V0RPW6_9BILA|nr:hypothetical protein T07_2633 [Trichinella nelsoni]